MHYMDYDGLEIEVPEGVYAPREDSELAAAALKLTIEKSGKEKMRVADIGTGSGILGLCAASSRNVASVVFADINEKALSTALENLQRNSSKICAECSFSKSDLFSDVTGGFDIIVFNAPYLPHSASDKNIESKAWDGGPEGIELSIRFLKEATAHLAYDGRILLVVSSLGSTQRLEKEMGAMGLEIESSSKVHYFFEDIFALTLRKRSN